MRWVALALAFAFAAATLPAVVGDHEQGDARRVSFDHKTGNEWWVEVVLGGPDAGSVADVEARDEGGPWVPLEKRSWGAWAASFHIEPGHDVRFRATWDDGERVRSCWFSHPEGRESCSTAAPRFDHKGGNEWWVQVQASGQPERVQAMDTGDPWHELRLQDWGDWAGSFHIEPGHEVRFRALADGQWHVSCWFTHPGGVTPTGDQTCGPAEQGAVDAAFGPRAGNAWWVETYVVVDDPIRSVEARADGGPWHPLTLRDWGTWAGSFSAPDGSVVQFRVTTDQGRDVSHGFVWPQADVVGGDGSWPQEGSHLHYATYASDPAPSTTRGTETLVHHDGAWWSSAQWETERYGEVHQDRRFCTDAHLPHGPTQVLVGQRVDVQVGTCHAQVYEVIVRHPDTESTHRDGRPVTVETWYADRTDPCGCLRWEAEWAQHEGIVLQADRSGRGSVGMDLVDTDAPIG